jgi:hypothetical protein
MLTNTIWPQNMVKTIMLISWSVLASIALSMNMRVVHSLSCLLNQEERFVIVSTVDCRFKDIS